MRFTEAYIKFRKHFPKAVDLLAFTDENGQIDAWSLEQRLKPKQKDITLDECRERLAEWGRDSPKQLHEDYDLIRRSIMKNTLGIADNKIAAQIGANPDAKLMSQIHASYELYITLCELAAAHLDQDQRYQLLRALSDLSYGLLLNTEAREDREPIIGNMTSAWQLTDPKYNREYLRECHVPLMDIAEKTCPCNKGYKQGSMSETEAYEEGTQIYTELINLDGRFLGNSSIYLFQISDPWQKIASVYHNLSKLCGGDARREYIDLALDARLHEIRVLEPLGSRAAIKMSYAHKHRAHMFKARGDRISATEEFAKIIERMRDSTHPRAAPLIGEAESMIRSLR